MSARDARRRMDAEELTYETHWEEGRERVHIEVGHRFWCSSLKLLGALCDCRAAVDVIEALDDRTPTERPTR